MIKVPVLKVVDGDGFLTKIRAFEVTGDPRDQEEYTVTARFGFIDAPELGQRGGHEAKAFLTSLIGGKWVELAILRKMDTGQSVDRYGRVVCVPFLTMDYSETFGVPLLITRNIELEMVANGWAWVLERYGPDERYLEALDEAKRQKRGLWAFENNIHPWEFKKQRYREAQRCTTDDPDARRSCPVERCNGSLVRRRGRFGDFLGCSNFPHCKYWRPMSGYGTNLP
jgi:endonuclease YncB( thermonuclease family)